MAKRFTDTEIWDEDWFLDLPNKYKLFWQYIKDKCDSAGFWRPNTVIAQRIIGEPLNVKEFISFINIGKESGKERVVVLPSGKWFIRQFFIFQYGDLFSPESRVHKGALKLLVLNGIHPSQVLGNAMGKLQDLNIQEIKEIAYCKGNKRLLEAYGKDIDRAKDKDKDKEQEQENIKELEIIKNLEISNTAAAAKIIELKNPKNGVLGADHVKTIANTVWKDQAWKEAVCIARTLSMPELKKWLANFNVSIATRAIEDFDVERYKRMSRGWIEVQQGRGKTVETGVPKKDSPTLENLSHNGD